MIITLLVERGSNWNIFFLIWSGKSRHVKVKGIPTWLIKSGKSCLDGEKKGLVGGRIHVLRLLGISLGLSKDRSPICIPWIWVTCTFVAVWRQLTETKCLNQWGLSFTRTSTFLPAKRDLSLLHFLWLFLRPIVRTFLYVLFSHSLQQCVVELIFLSGKSCMRKAMPWVHLSTICPFYGSLCHGRLAGRLSICCAYLSIINGWILLEKRAFYLSSFVYPGHALTWIRLNRRRQEIFGRDVGSECNQARGQADICLFFF